LKEHKKDRMWCTRFSRLDKVNVLADDG
jgi:hypothetical protein